MSETEVAAPAAAPTPVSLTEHAGAILRCAREAQGLHIAAMAVALKVPVKKLEALEAGRYDELPDMVFVRSLAMSVCRTLKIVPGPVLAALPSVPVHSIQVASTGLNTEFKIADASSYTSLHAQLTSPLGLGAGVLLLATAAVFLWQGQAEDANTAATPVATPTQPTAPGVAVPAPQLQAATSAAEGALSMGLPTEPQVLEIRAHGASWVEVLDADATPLLRKLTVDGEVLRVGGKLPLSVTAGRADQIVVQVRGQMLDLAPLARNNVARFEVK